MDTVFAPELAGLDREEIRRWYNGYNWLGESVYNPFDVLLLFRGRVFVFEFKVMPGAATGEAMAQIKAKGYAQKYLGRGEPVHLIGIEFSRAARNVVGFAAETLA